MSPTSEYISLLAIASTNDGQLQARLDQLKKAKVLKEEKKTLKEQEEREKERKEREKRLNERKNTLKEKFVENSLLNSTIPMKEQFQTIEKSIPFKKSGYHSKSMSFKELMSHTSNINPEIFRINPTVKLDPKPDMKNESKSKSISYLNTHLSLKHKINSEPFQIHKKLITSAKIPLVGKKQNLLLRSEKSASLSPKISLNKSKKKYFLSQTESKNSIKSKIISGFHPNDMVALSQGPKRDFRTIEEIQNDLWRRKGKNYSFLHKNTEKKDDISLNNISSKNQTLKDLPSKNHSFVSKQNIPYKKTKTDLLNKNNILDNDVSSEIWKIFGRKKEDYILNDYDSDSDMEVTAAELEKEEEFSMKIGAIEDKEEEHREIERRMKKKKITLI
ncbi:hypothetical protein PCANB_000087 [Pneumocystis canis]|nr:hypothetical protein PCANB_000087 [Pneumocystis canis]